MKRRTNLFKTLICAMVAIVTTTPVTQSLCLADTSSSPASEMMIAFSDSLDSELGDRINALLEERGLEIDLENGVSTIAWGAEIILVPLTPTDLNQMTTPNKSYQKSHFLAHLNHERLGRFLVFLEVMRSQRDEITSLKIIFPSGRGVVVNMNPFYIYQIDASQTGISLQDSDDLENTIIISDTCETLRIIAIALAAACLAFVNPILCAIAAAVAAIVESFC